MPEDLLSTLAEIEAHVDASGWDRPPQLFALVGGTAYEQDALPEGPLDRVLGGIDWPAEVDGCALTQEIVVLPPDAEAELYDAGVEEGDGVAGADLADLAARAAAHPQRREARIVAGVLRDGAAGALLRLRGAPDEIVTGADLAPNLVAALRATLSSAGPDRPSAGRADPAPPRAGC